MSQNKLTVYSNGLTRIQRFVTVEGRTTITIPVRKQYVADVVATLGVKGNVRVVEPASYSNDASKTALKLDPKNVYYELATKLSGADVKVTSAGKPVEGRLAGVHQVETLTLGVITKNIEFVIATKDGIQTFNQGHVSKLEFTQPEVSQLIATALSKNFESVRPESVLVKLVVQPVGDNSKVEALLDYAMPTAAWQSVYKIEIGEKETTLEYNAKLDNPTDEDWLQTKVCCVVGEPITFDTDLGEVRTPQRAKVKLVDDQAVAPVRAQEALRKMRQAQSKGVARGAMMLQACSMGGGGLESAGGFEALEDADELTGDVNYCGTVNLVGAAQAGATAEEVGDFAKFTSDDVIDVRGNVGGVVRLFRKPFEAKEVLFFDAGQDSERAYRGLRVTNTTDSTLGKGMATAYLKGDNLGGQAVFNTLKPGKSQTLVFSRENGVAVNYKPKSNVTSRIAVGLTNGELWWQDRTQTEVAFHFDNMHKDEGFDVEVNHAFQQNEPKFEITGMSSGAGRDSITAEETKNGLKLTLKLAADEVVEFGIKETKVNKSGWSLTGSNGFHRLSHYFSSTTDPASVKLRASDAYRKCESLMTELQKLSDSIDALENEVEQLTTEQERLLKLVQAGSAASQLDKWQGNLDKAEDRIQEIQKKLVPAAQKAQEAKELEVDAALKALSFSWAEGEEAKTASKPKK